MLRGPFQKLSSFVTQLLNNPGRVFVICVTLLCVGLLLDGSLFRLWRLHRDSAELANRIELVQQKTSELTNKIKQAQDPAFIELEAREKFDLAAEGDLVFVFSDEE